MYYAIHAVINMFARYVCSDETEDQLNHESNHFLRHW